MTDTQKAYYDRFISTVCEGFNQMARDCEVDEIREERRVHKDSYSHKTDHYRDFGTEIF